MKISTSFIILVYLFIALLASFNISSAMANTAEPDNNSTSCSIRYNNYQQTIIIKENLKSSFLLKHSWPWTRRIAIILVLINLCGFLIPLLCCFHNSEKLLWRTLSRIPTLISPLCQGVLWLILIIAAVVMMRESHRWLSSLLRGSHT